MTSLLVAVALVMHGWGSQYAPGTMQSVIRVRQAGRTSYTLPTKLPKVDGFVAVPECSRLGDLIWLRPEGTIRWESFLIVDCGGPQLRRDGLTGGQWMARNNVLVELDWPTVVRWGGQRNRGIRIEATNENPRHYPRDWLVDRGPMPDPMPLWTLVQKQERQTEAHPVGHDDEILSQVLRGEIQCR